jgi:bisanhydrobacterioruberin hydratase
LFIKYSKCQIATAIAILFHVVGFIGIALVKNDFIIRSTPFNLFLMFGLLIWTQKEKNSSFWIFLAITFLLGLAVEIIGVNTQLLFGEYSYGKILGYQLYNVPIVIGLNWFVIIYCCGIGIHSLLLKAINKLAEEKAAPRAALKAISVMVDGATLAVFFDWLMEPVATVLGYWQWKGSIPLYNYACWFVIAMVMLALFHFLNFKKENKFAVHLLLIQTLFFLLLRVFLTDI